MMIVPVDVNALRQRALVRCTAGLYRLLFIIYRIPIGSETQKGVAAQQEHFLFPVSTTNRLAA